MILHCNISTDFSIEDGDGNKLTIEQAKQIYNDGQAEDYNLGFKRLVSFDWNVERLKQFYIDNP